MRYSTVVLKSPRIDSSLSASTIERRAASRVSPKVQHEKSSVAHKMAQVQTPCEDVTKLGVGVLMQTARGTDLIAEMNDKYE